LILVALLSKEKFVTGFNVGLLGSFLIAGAVCAQRPLVVEDFSKFQDVADPRLSPDGQWILYTVTTTDVVAEKRNSDIWVAKWDGSPPRRLTYTPDSESSPRWSPDGTYISFLSSRPGGKAKGNQVWVLNRAGGEAHQLTELKGRISTYEWSPDSKRLALVYLPGDDAGETPAGAGPGKEPPSKPWVIDRYHFKQDVQGYLTSDAQSRIFLYDIETKKIEPLTSETAYGEEGPAWSPDGTRIAFVSNRDPNWDRTKNTDVFVAEAKPGSTARRLTTFLGTDGGKLAWSPDGSLVAYGQGSEVKYNFHSLNRLAIVPAVGGTPRILTEALDRGTSVPTFTPDGKSIDFLVTDDRTEYLGRVPVAGGAVQRLVSGPKTVHSVSSEAGRTVALVSTDTEPGEIYAVEGTKLRKLTFHNDSLIAGLKLVPGEDIGFRSKDGTEVHALLTKPLDYETGKRYPTLVRIHGGPTGQDAHSFQFERQLFAANGYVVLNVNYRGSSGRGAKFSESIFADWGNREVDDVLAAADYAVANGIADPQHLGIGGWSYGGVLTDYVIAKDTRFKAAISGAGSANHISLYGQDQYVYLYDNEFGPPWKNPDLWIKFSYPFFHADKIRTPTLFMGGEKDFNVPIIGGEQMYQALKTLNVPTQLVIYPGQNHGFTKPSFIRDRYERYLAWYDKYLKTGEAPHISLPAGDSH
jgi:dipeptidyl aminopeptidase/acylaminoacyl peptidase